MLLKLKRRKFQQKKIESRKWLWTLRNDYLSCPFHRQRPLWLLLCHLGLRHHHHQYFRVKVGNFAYFWTISNTLMLLATSQRGFLVLGNTQKILTQIWHQIWDKKLLWKYTPLKLFSNPASPFRVTS